MENLAINEILKELRTLEELSAKPKLSAHEERQYTATLAKLSLLKQGISGQQLAEARMQELCRELGLRPAKRFTADQEFRSAWHQFVRTGDVRTNYQATSEWGNVTGLTYSDSTGSGTGTQGGAFVPPQYSERLFASLAAVDEIVQDGNSQVIETDNGAALAVPAIDDVSGSPVVATRSVIVAEATQNANGFVKADSVQFGACPTYRSGIVYCATELEQDSAFVMLQLFEAVFNRRHALAFGSDMIDGAGTLASGGNAGVPYGIVSALPSGTVVTSGTSSLAIGDLETLYTTLGVQYRKGGKFYMNSNTLLVVSKLVESANRNNSGTLDKLFGRDIVVCESMNSATAGATAAIVFAHPSYILQRRVKNGAFIRRFTQNSPAAEAGMVGFQSYFRADARPMLYDSIQPPVASLNVHA